MRRCLVFASIDGACEYHPECADCYQQILLRPSGLSLQDHYCLPGFSTEHMDFFHIVFFDFTRGNPQRPRIGRPQPCPRRTGVLESCQWRRPNSSKLSQLGLMGLPLMLQSDSDCCAAAQWAFVKGHCHGHSCFPGYTATAQLFRCFDPGPIVSFSDKICLGHVEWHAVLFLSPGPRTSVLVVSPSFRPTGQNNSPTVDSRLFRSTKRLSF